jgi:hypothetical protein
MYNIIDDFISFVKGYFEEQNDEKSKNIVFKYFGIENDRKYTFDEIGTLYSVTKQRIQEIEKKHIDNLKILISGKKLNRGNYICEEILISEISELRKKIEERKIIKRNEFREIIKFKENDEPWENLLVNILNSDILLIEKCNCEVIILKSLKNKDLKEEIIKTYNILKENIIPMSKDDLIIKSKKGRRKFDDNYIKMSINCLKLEQNNKNNLFLAIDKNFSAGDLAYRILWLENKPLTKDDIFIKINQELSDNNLPNIEKDNLVNQMTLHSKIVSIRKKWELKSWGNEKKHIKEIIKKLLNSEGVPLSKDEIRKKISNKYSDIKEKSINSYLSYDDFLQLKNGNIILEEWKSKYISEIRERRKKQKFDEMLLEIYRYYGKEKLSFKEIFSYANIEFDINEAKLKEQLEKKEYISKILEENINYYILKKNHIEILGKKHGNIINGIKNKAKQLLMEKGDMELSKLTGKLKNDGYNKATIYSALQDDKKFKKFSSFEKGLMISLKSTKNLLNINKYTENDLRQFLEKTKTEEARFDFKQGFLMLNDTRRFDEKSFEKIMKNVCAMANHGVGKTGILFIGITDKEEDTKQIEKLDAINVERVNNFGIVGLEREAIILKKDLEKYQNYILEKIEKSKIEDKLKTHIKSNMTFIPFQGKSILMLEMECIDGPSLYNDELYIRKGPNLHKVQEKESKLRNDVYTRCHKK